MTREETLASIGAFGNRWTGAVRNSDSGPGYCLKKSPDPQGYSESGNFCKARCSSLASLDIASSYAAK